MATSRRRSFALWTLLDLLLIASSYAIPGILALSCFLLFFTHNLFLMIGGTVVGSTILWAIWPRRVRYKLPGIVLTQQQSPEFFAELHAIAGRLDEKMPVEVRLVWDLSAAVSESGFFESRRRRYLVIGLPLFALLTVSELRAVLVHEFGHFYRGDTRLTPWFHRASLAVARTMQALRRPSDLARFAARNAFIYMVTGLVTYALDRYWQLFLRLTFARHRQQEFLSDELTAFLAGADPFIRALQLVRSGEHVVLRYWSSELVPAVLAGYHPPATQGFADYFSSPAISSETRLHLEYSLKNEQTRVHSSHPPLRERIGRLQTLNAPQRWNPEDNRSALSLFPDLASLEIALFRFVWPHLKPLQSLDWAETKPRVLLQSWKAMVTQVAPRLRTYSIAGIPVALQSLSSLVELLPDPPGRLLTPEQRAERGYDLLAGALALRLIDQGWQLRSSPGRCELTRGDQTIDPFAMVRSCVNQLPGFNWSSHIRALGIVSCPLVPLAASGHA